MKLKRSNLLIEPPSSAASDIAFILIVFFLVCASVQPDSGRAQLIPKAEQEKEKTKQSQNIEVTITRATAMIGGDAVLDAGFLPRIRSMLAGKTREEDKVVIVKSKEDVPYERWIKVTGMIEEAGGIITLELEEEQTTVVQ